MALMAFEQNEAYSRHLPFLSFPRQSTGPPGSAVTWINRRCGRRGFNQMKPSQTGRGPTCVAYQDAVSLLCGGRGADAKLLSSGLRRSGAPN